MLLDAPAWCVCYISPEFSVACIAAPIRDETGACVATISIVLADRQAEARGAEIGAAVRAAAETVERSLGH